MILCLIKLSAGHKKPYLRCAAATAAWNTAFQREGFCLLQYKTHFSWSIFFPLLNLEQKSPQQELELTVGMRHRPVAGMGPNSPSACSSTFTLVSFNFLGS